MAYATLEEHRQELLAIANPTPGQHTDRDELLLSMLGEMERVVTQRLHPSKAVALTDYNAQSLIDPDTEQPYQSPWPLISRFSKAYNAAKTDGVLGVTRDAAFHDLCHLLSRLQGECYHFEKGRTIQPLGGQVHDWADDNDWGSFTDLRPVATRFFQRTQAWIEQDRAQLSGTPPSVPCSTPLHQVSAPQCASGASQATLPPPPCLRNSASPPPVLYEDDGHQHPCVLSINTAHLSRWDSVEWAGPSSTGSNRLTNQSYSPALQQRNEEWPDNSYDRGHTLSGFLQLAGDHYHSQDLDRSHPDPSGVDCHHQHGYHEANAGFHGQGRGFPSLNPAHDPFGSSQPPFPNTADQYSSSPGHDQPPPSVQPSPQRTDYIGAVTPGDPEEDSTEAMLKLMAMNECTDSQWGDLTWIFSGRPHHLLGSHQRTHSKEPTCHRVQPRPAAHPPQGAYIVLPQSAAHSSLGTSTLQPRPPVALLHLGSGSAVSTGQPPPPAATSSFCPPSPGVGGGIGADAVAEVGFSQRRGGADSVAEKEPDPWLGVTARQQRPAMRRQAHVNPKGVAQCLVTQQRKEHTASEAREQAATKQAHKDVGARLQRWMDEPATKVFSVLPGPSAPLPRGVHSIWPASPPHLPSRICAVQPTPPRRVPRRVCPLVVCPSRAPGTSPF